MAKKKRPAWLPPPPKRAKAQAGTSGAAGVGPLAATPKDDGARQSTRQALQGTSARATAPIAAKAAITTATPQRGRSARAKDSKAPAGSEDGWLQLSEQPQIRDRMTKPEMAKSTRPQPAGRSGDSATTSTSTNGWLNLAKQPLIVEKMKAPRMAKSTQPDPALRGGGGAKSAASKDDAAKAAILAELQDLPLDMVRRKGIALHNDGKHKEAIVYYEHILSLNPNDAKIWSNLGVALRQAEHFEAAISVQKRALTYAPREGSYWSNLGNALKDGDRLDEAIEAHKQALALKPGQANWHHNLGVTLREAGKHKEALEQFERAIRLKPKTDAYRWDRAVMLLHLGRWKEGWVGYDWRYRLKELTPRRTDLPRWLGEPIPGKRLLIYPEQGFGDTLFAIRYLPQIKERSQAHIILIVKPQLKRLFKELEGVDEFSLVDRNKATDFDYHASLMDLPGFCDARPDNTPPLPKLHIPEEARQKAQEWLEPAGDRFTVGVVWSGSVTFKNNRRRAVDVDRFVPLAENQDIQLVSLQKGPREGDLERPGVSPLFIDVGRKVKDFSETAAVIEALDLVIMTDSSVAHLCGSLDQPVWNLLNFVPYWLYGDHKERTLWYPSMRLLRQPFHNAWDPVFAIVKDELNNAVALKKKGKWPPPAWSITDLYTQGKAATPLPFDSRRPA